MKLKRCMSILLVLAMILAVCPANVFAAAGDPVVDLSSLKVTATKGSLSVSGDTANGHAEGYIYAVVVPEMVFAGTSDNNGLGGVTGVYDSPLKDLSATTSFSEVVGYLADASSGEMNYLLPDDEAPDGAPVNNSDPDAPYKYVPASAIAHGATTEGKAAYSNLPDADNSFEIALNGNIKTAAGYGFRKYVMIITDGAVNYDRTKGNVVVKEFTVDENGDLAKDPAKATVTGLGNKTYDGNAVAPTVEVKKGADGAGDAVTGFAVEYKVKGAADTTYSTTAPKDAAAYEYRITHNDYSIVDGTGEFTISKKPLTAASVSANNKPYDGNTTGTGSVTLNGFENGETATAVATYVFDNANAGTGKTVTVTVTGFAAGATANVNNYDLPAASTTTADITPIDQAKPELVNPGTVTYGDEVTLAVKDNSTVTYNVTEGTGKATVDGNKMTADQAGTITLTATKAGDANHNSATSDPLTITIEKAEAEEYGFDADDVEEDMTLAEIEALFTVIGVKDEELTGTGKFYDTEGTEISSDTAVVADKQYVYVFTPTGAFATNYKETEFEPLVLFGNTSVVVTYEAGENGTLEGAATETVVNGQKPTKVPTPKANDGYKFDGWYNAAGEKVNPADITVTAPVTYTAKFVGPDHKAYMEGTVKADPEKGVEAKFDPEGDLSRAQAVTMLVRLTEGFDANAAVDTTAPFNDVTDSNTWFFKYVAFAKKAGITEGRPDGSFGPDDKITRQEFAKMLASFMELTPAGTADFADAADIADWAQGHVAVLKAKGVVKGDENANTFRPEDNIKRAEAAAMVNRAINRAQSSADADKLSAELNQFSDVSTKNWFFNDVMEATVEHFASDFNCKPLS